MEVGEEAGLKLQSTPKLRDFLRTVAAATTVSEKSRAAALNYTEDKTVFVPEYVYRDLGPSDRSPIHQVLAGSSIFLESPRPREQSRELKARLKKLQELEKQYDELVQDITKQTEEKEHFSSYLGFGLYVAVTMIISFAFGYTVFSSLFRETHALHAAGGALGLIAGMVMETLLLLYETYKGEK